MLAETIPLPAVVALNTYREGLEELLTLESDKIVTNNLAEYAPVFFEVILKHAKTHVRILCDNLDSHTFDNPRVLAQLEKALDRYVFINIVTRQDPQAPQFLKLINGRKNARILKANESWHHRWNRNVAIMDESTVRIETLGKKPQIMAMMYNPDKVLGWLTFFDRLANMEPAEATP